MSNTFVNTSLFPATTATGGHRDWLNEIIKTANLEDFDPILKPHKTADGYVNDDGTPYQEFDYMAMMPSFETLSGIGDLRYSLGHMVSAVMQVYLPRVNVYTEVSQAGGCQIINEYICDADGNPIQKTSSSCPSNMSMEIIQPQEIVDFVLTRYASKKQEDVDAFIESVTENYVKMGYQLELCLITDFPYFVFVRMKKAGDVKYVRYYYDDRDALSTGFNLPFTYIPKSDMTPELIAALSLNVPLYNPSIVI